MGYVENTDGPKKLEFVKKLGPNYFGISENEFAEELQTFLDEEMSGVIDAVHLDPRQRPFLISSASGGKTQKFYLDSFGYKLKGTIKAIINNKETEVKI